jgi:HlyD family secretion protein
MRDHGSIGRGGQARLRWGGLCVCLVGVLAVTAGCSKRPPPRQPIHARTEVQLVKAERKTLLRKTGQPGFVEAYEQTALYPLKVSGFVAPWQPGKDEAPTSGARLEKKGKNQRPDIGDRITRGEILAHINVPDLEAEYREKQAEAALDVVQIKVAEELVNVAEENVKSATAQVAEARANVNKYKADVERWESEVKRLASVKEGVLDQQILSEGRKQLKVSTAAQEAAEATTLAARAMEAARKADVAKARVDVEAARARAKVAEEAVQRLAALVSYTDIRAPYDGVVMVRNVVTGDYVQPSTGDATGPRSLQDQGNSKGFPLYVVARTDPVRVFVDVSEMEANGVGPGSPATVRISAIDTAEFTTTVTRLSGGLQNRTRTRRVEIDLKNPDGRILPGMYAYGEVQVKRTDVWALPLKTVTMIGNQNCCYLYEDGKAVQTPVQTGIDDGRSIEVLMKKRKGAWVPFDGSEQVIQADLSEISDGQEVRLGTEKKD